MYALSVQLTTAVRHNLGVQTCLLYTLMQSCCTKEAQLTWKCGWCAAFTEQQQIVSRLCMLLAWVRSVVIKVRQSALFQAAVPA